MPPEDRVPAHGDRRDQAAMSAGDRHERGSSNVPHPPMPRDERGWHVSPAPDGRGAPPPRPGPNRSLWRNFLIFFLVLLAVNWASVLIAQSPSQERVQVPYSPTFLQQVQAGNVSEISSQGATVQGTFRRKVTYAKSSPTTLFATEVPGFANTDQLSSLLIAKGVQINARPISSGPSTLAQILLGFGPTLLIFGVIFYMVRRAARMGAAGPLGGFGRSQARKVEEGQVMVTFSDVAGIEEAKSELYEVVDFLRSPDRYRRLGGRIPRGVLLSGLPGTGKTLLARAVAGEAHAAFFSIAATEFVEAIVGVGAARVRDLFKQAKESAPAIIFIDELDAIGRSRANAIAISGANDEREQTLNQILTEMDGFEANVGVVVLSATNRPEILDPALLRPGRFDRRVAVQPPDRDGRRKILEVHTRHIPLAPGVDLGRVASSTPGMVGADLANLANEAALLAARRNHDQVEMADFTDALEKILLGAPRGVVLSPADRERTAYHEAGHALVGMLTPGADPVRKVSIIPRGMALGVTLSAPEADRFNYTKEYLDTKIRVALGGRVAEEIVYGSMSTGAQSDIEGLTNIARQMVGAWGMSPAVGPVAVLPQDGNPFAGGAPTSEYTQRLVDEEVRRIVEDAHQGVTELLTENRGRLERITQALLAGETLDEVEAYAAAGVERSHAEEQEVAVAALAPAAAGDPVLDPGRLSRGQRQPSR